MFEIKNKQVESIYKRWKKIYYDSKLPLETRLKAFSIMNVIEVLVAIYEDNEKMDQEDIDDLFVSWGKNGLRPVLPEEMGNILESIKKQKYK